ncbi:sigma 54-interacting transcriptional regulator [Pseudomonas plecoglossicida]|uniref:sigma 54-interacting transcriptional regulator n=1 Tax=Pseudomonas TaxID=286 RepID=UPI000760ECB4|nr:MULTISPECIES: sigma 54-interacting transcriptional regulator [Pseudomonas]MCE0904523.1 sigma 54-interacting transcriptional regulator [Pseudomonas alloputida]WPE27743.1 Anaerobic nitric oxide reductase transcription regulator NorR [Pseudomonas hunanensis]MDQ7967137.1 sigma 54-interacting transcriptional regulator [Pseudomonas plecoglossicida]WBM44665.1 sigma 54-interacting transcriptional regulator [Pseudomonas putida]WFG01185.1 sigma 54-interacting transcriptional regulator [Pseudomonas pu
MTDAVALGVAADSAVAMLLIHPVDDRVLQANNAALDLLGCAANELSGHAFSHFLRGGIALWVSFTDEVLTQGEAWSDDLLLVDLQLRQIAVEVSASAVEGGKIVLAVQRRDLLEQRRNRAEARRQHRLGHVGWERISQVFERIQQQNRLILGAVGEGIYGLDTRGQTTFINPAAERILGWSAVDMIGQDAHHLFHHSHSDGRAFEVNQCPIHASFSDGQVHRVDHEVFWHKSGEPIAVEYTSTPIFEMGRLVGAVVLFRDIRERQRTEARLRDALSEVEQLKTRLEMENQYLQEEINAHGNHHEIVGESPAVKHLLQQIDLVAATDANVLVTGESGTGKELVARAIHASSPRRDRPLIRVNCAAVPRELFESEFFGHLKGAFTGAVSNRVGRFELADGGTLFLDEVGEIPLELQSKLLRVLQDRQFEPVGDNRTRAVDVRVIAATNRDLRDMVARGAFREDLYFRLNVFPIRSVPLRERLEDIPLLASHFLERASLAFNKPGIRMSLTQVAVLQQYAWPGNIRELQNVIERQTIVSRDGRVSFHEVLAPSAPSSGPVSSTSQCQPEPTADKDWERQMKLNAISVLKRTAGKVSGEGGAAQLLGLKPTTLASRLKKWGVDPRDYK